MDNSSNNYADNRKNIVSWIWFQYFPYWPVFLLLLLGCVTGTWFYLLRATPLYEATATLLIKDEKKGIDDSRMIESLNLISTKKIVENEIEVLGSRSLMDEVVINLKLYAPVFRKGKWRDSVAYSSSPVRIEARDAEHIIENPTIPFSYDAGKSVVIINKNEYPLNQWVATDYGVLRFSPVNTRNNIQPGQFYFSLTDPKNVTLNFSRRLEAVPSSKLSTVIDLKIRDEDPRLAENILNQLILAYNKAAVNDKNFLAANTLSFVQERLDFIGHHLDSIERKIQQYKANRGAVDISSQGKLFLENVSANDRKVGDVNIQLAVLEQIEKYVTSRDLNGGIVPSTMGASDPLLTGLLNRLYDAELKRETIKKTTGENSPEMVALSDQIEKIRPNILENIRSQRKSLEASRLNLAITNNGYSSMLQAIPQKERDLVEISRQQNIENNIYSFLLQKREEAALSNSSTVADTRVVDSARASLSPVSPNKRFIYIIAIMGAFGIGITLITAKEMFSRNILYRSEIEGLTSVPIIGEIGFEKTKDPIVIHEGTTSMIAEQFRRLRASLNFIPASHKSKKILVTSTVPGEGKSFIAANFGLSLAMAGKKVLLIEADLSNPSLSEKLDMYEDKGLSGYLAGEYKPAEIIKKTKANTNLFVIPAGVLPPNPSELFMNEKMDELMAYLDENFDYVVVDTAPVGAMSDAYILSPLCDVTLYVVRHGVTPRIAVERLNQSNKINELKNMAIVFNGVRKRGFGKGSYGNGYDYGYAYKRRKTGKKQKPVLTASRRASV